MRSRPGVPMLVLLATRGIAFRDIAGLGAVEHQFAGVPPQRLEWLGVAARHCLTSPAARSSHIKMTAVMPLHPVPASDRVCHSVSLCEILDPTTIH